MTIWDDEIRPATPRPPQPPDPSGLLERAREDVRAAAHKDAADIVARARRDIRRIVTDARRELLELSAQLQAANVDLPDSALPDPSVIDAAATADSATWLAAGPVTHPDAPPDADPVPSAVEAAPASVEPPPSSPVHPEPVAESRPVAFERLEPVPDPPFLFGGDAQPAATARPSALRTFVTLFTLAGAVIVAGTVWYLQRGTPAPVEPSRVPPTAAAPVSSPSPAPVAEPAAEEPAVAAPAVANASGLRLAIEARRDTWLRTTVDGVADAGRLYAAGERREFTGVHEVIIRAGDAGGVVVSEDGGAPVPFGPAGAPLTRRFGTAAAAAPVRQETATPPAPAQPTPASTRPAADTPPPAAPARSAEPTPQTQPAPPATRSAAPPAASASGPRGTTPPTRVDVAAAARQWVDAYHRRDRAVLDGMAAAAAITDDRKPEERFPFGLEVTRAFEDEQLQLSGDSATFSARMIERAATGAHASRVTQTWVRRQGEWHLQDAHLVRDASPAAR